MATATHLSGMQCIHGMEDYPQENLRLMVVSPAPEFLLAKAYDALLEDGSLQLLFFTALPTRQAFLDWLRLPGVRYTVGLICPMLDESRVEIAGLGAVWDIYPAADGSLCGEVGHCFQRKFQVNGIPRRLAVKMLDYAFGPLGMNVLAGVTPVVNRPALRFIESMGFERTHVVEKFREVQGRVCDCQVSAMRASEWKEKSRDLR